MKYLRTILTTIIVIVSFTFVTGNVYGTTYYVAKNGNDSNSGTEAQPWLTIQKAANTIVAGDTVYIKKGTYNEVVSPQNSGSSESYITYSAYSGDTVTIDGNNITLPSYESGLFEVEDKSYIKISGLRIINAGPNDNNAGIYVDNSSHVIIENNYTYNTVSSGIGVWDSNNITIDGNEVQLACNDGEQECITVAGTDTFEIKNNHVHHSGPGTKGGEGIDAKDGSSNGSIFNNYVHDIQGEKPGIYLDSWDKRTFDINVYQNTVYDNGAGISLASENGGILENINIYNNIVYDNRINGLEIGNWGEAGVSKRPVEKVTFINNTVYNNGSNSWGGGIQLENPDAKNIIVRNNIFSQNLLYQISNEAQLLEANLTVDHNLIHDYTGEYEYEIRGTDYVEGDPKFVNPSGADFHLQGNSPAINQGTSTNAPNEDYDRNQRPQGAGYDIGAYEYIESTSTKDKKIYFPHIASDGKWETEIGIINIGSGQSLSGDLKAYENEGLLVGSKSISLSSKARREMIVGSEFSNQSDIGYMVFESDSQNVTGYTKFYIDGKFRVAIPGASDVNNGDIYISHIASDAAWTTGISILNTTSSSKNISVEFDNGTTKTVTISANEHQAFTIRDLFDGNPQSNINSAVIKNGSGIVGLEIFGSTESSGLSYLSGILLKDDTTTTIYYPHIASDSTWGTGIVAYNPSSTSSDLTITPYSAGGISLSSQVITLAGQEKYVGTPESLNLPDGTAWFSILASSPITGFELFSTKDGNQLGGYTGVGISGKNGVFAKIEKDGGTGIAFVNIENASAVVTMSAYDDSGNVIATEKLNLNAFGKVVDVPENLFSKDISTATYIAYLSDKEVVGFQLNVSSDSMMLDALPGAAPSVTNLSRDARLQAAMTWMYQIQDLDVEGAVDALAATNYPLLVLEPGHNFTDFPYNTSDIVQSLKTTSDGQSRLLLAYIDIGQAEDYRDYWKDNWVAPTATQRGTPDFLITIDPDGWSGNYPVAYWRQEWKNIYIGNNGIVAELARLGFDGVYLDWVEAYDDDTVRMIADEDGVNPELEMIQFIEEIMQAGRVVTEGFLLVPQNAPHLINTDPTRYVATINALAVEDTWFHGDGDADWDDPRAGDLHERHDEPGWTTADRLKEYEKYIERGLPVFSVDYCISEKNTAQVYRDARAAGLRPLVTRVSLSRLTETPPDAY